MKRIKILDKNLINQIAAGEVIERPASVVKELVENSIDAGASKLEIEVSNECRNLRVADNGSGIHKDDVVLAFSRHATSKMSEEKDLWEINTLGFRGEALASIISIAKVTCTSRTSEAETGIKVICENSDVKINETGCAVGTIMDIKDLFYNTPVRQKFLKSNHTELAKILEVLQGIAISHPNVAITLVHKANNALKTSGSGDISIAISEIYSKSLLKELVPISKTDFQHGFEAKGYTSAPDFTRANKKAIYTFVNGRTVKCPILLKAIDNAYRSMLPSGRYPFTVLDLKIPSGDVDINVHPAKREVRYSNANMIFGFIYSAVKSALEIKAFQPETEQSFDFGVKESHNPQPQFQRESVASQDYEKTDFEALKSARMPIRDDYSFVQQPKMIFDSNEISEVSPKFRVIGQLFNTYILIEQEGTLQLIDQHIAHERYLYEKLKNKVQNASQLLFTSDIIELEPSNVAKMLENKATLAEFGFEFEIIDNKNLIIKKLPQIIANNDHFGIVNDLLEALDGSLETIEDKIVITMSCKAAVKAGEKLSIWQMEELIENWSKTKNPKTCPHGRPIIKEFSSKEIAKFFDRVDAVTV